MEEDSKNLSVKEIIRKEAEKLDAKLKKVLSIKGEGQDVVHC